MPRTWGLVLGRDTAGSQDHDLGGKTRTRGERTLSSSPVRAWLGGGLILFLSSDNPILQRCGYLKQLELAFPAKCFCLAAKGIAVTPSSPRRGSSLILTLKNSNISSNNIDDNNNNNSERPVDALALILEKHPWLTHSLSDNLKSIDASASKN